ncbi:MAG: hypothetical protein EGR33_04890 [Prevotella sp.]|nr:hypothetical protein [Prevotella sp.]
MQFSAAKALPLTFDILILNTLPEKGSTSALAMLFALKKSARFLGQNGMTVAAVFLVPFILALYVVCSFLRC